MKHRKLKHTTIALTLAVVAVTAGAEQVTIKSAQVIVREGKGQVYKEVATAKKGEQLTVIAHEGSWIKVQAGDKTGYIAQNATEGGGVKQDGFSKGLSAVAGSSSDAAAGKGLDESIAYAQSKGFNTGALDKMIAISESITAPEWESFTKEGKVGPNK